MAAAFTIFTSLRYDPALTGSETPTHAGRNAAASSPLYMVDLHRDRLLRAATHFQWTPVINLLTGPEGLETLSDKVLSALANHRAPQRVKVTIDEHGTFAIEASPTPPRPLHDLFPARLPPPGSDATTDDPARAEEDSWTIFIDDENRIAPSAFTHLKTSKREMYDAARAWAGIGPPDRIEVVVVDENGHAMEGSMTTPYFWRGGRWVTPPTRGELESGEWQGGQDGTTRRWALEREMVGEEDVEVGSFVDGEECWVSNGVRGFLWGRITLR